MASDIRAEGGKVIWTMEPDEARRVAHVFHGVKQGVMDSTEARIIDSDLRMAANRTGEQIAVRWQS